MPSSNGPVAAPADSGGPPNCPSCARPSNGAKICPFCGGATTDRLSIFSVMVAACGLLVVAAVYFLLAFTSTTEQAAIADLTPAKHNQRSVKVRGIVTRSRFTPDSYGRGGYLGLTLADPDAPDAEISVRASGPGALRISQANLVPARGDVVDVTGAVMLFSKVRQITVTGPDGIAFVQRSADKASAATLTVAQFLATPKDYDGKMVRFEEVEIVDVGGPVVKVADPGKKESVVVFGAPAVDSLRRGQRVRVVGKVAWYEARSVWEVKIARGDLDGLVVLGGGVEEPPELETTVAGLLAEPKKFEGKTVRLPRVEIVKVDEQWTCRVADPGGGKESLLVFGGPVETLSRGQIVRVRGQVEYYEKGRYWEIKVRKGDAQGVVQVDKSAGAGGGVKPNGGGAGGGTAVAPVGSESAATVKEVLAAPKTFEGKRVRLGKVEVARVAKQWVIEVADPGETQSITVFGIDPTAFTVGQKVTVRGIVEWYERGKAWQVKIAKGDRDGVVPSPE